MPIKEMRDMSLSQVTPPPPTTDTPNHDNVDSLALQEQQSEHNGFQVPPVTRELTQTDRLNKRLLASFLDHINSAGHMMEQFSANMQHVTPDDTQEDDFEEQLFVGAQIM